MITTALASARKQVTIAKSGRDWQVSTWDAKRRVWHSSTSRDFWTARASQTRAIAARALAGIGMDDADSFYLSAEAYELAWERGRATVEDVVRAAIEIVRANPSRWQAATVKAASAARVKVRGGAA